MALYHEDIISIELNSGSIARSFLSHTIGEGDNMANRFGVALFRDGEPVSAESRTVTGIFIAPDGNRYALSEASYPGSTGKSGNRAWVQLPAVCYNVEGQFSLVIKLSGSGVNGTMRIVDGMVCYTGESGAVVPTSTIPTTADLIAAYENAIAVIDSSVRFDEAQDLTDTEKLQAKNNIGANYQPQIDEINDAIEDNVFDINGIRNNLNHNAFDFLDTREMGTSTTEYGITFAFDENENKCAVSGTATYNTFKNMYGDHFALPEGMEIGGTYYIRYSGENVSFEVFYYDQNETPVNIISTKEDASFTIPDEAVGLIMRLYVRNATTVSETVRYSVLNALTNEELTVMAQKVENARLAGNIIEPFDFNDYRIAKQLYVSRTALISSTHAPDGFASSQGAILDIVPSLNNGAAGDAVIQMLISVANGHMYIRRYAGGVSGSWSDWLEQYSEELHTDGVEDLASMVNRKTTDNHTSLTRKSGYNIHDVIPLQTWESGNITSTGAETANSHYIRSGYMRTDSGDQFFAQYETEEDSEYSVRFFFYDSSKNFLGFLTGSTAFSGDVKGQAYVTVGDGYIRFVVLKNPADIYDISPSDIANVDFYVSRNSYKNAEIIRVATNNVRNWGTEHNYGYTGDYDSNVRFYKKLYSSVDATIMGFQEFSPYMDAAHAHPGAVFFRNLFAGFYNSISPRIPVASNLPVENFTAGKFSTGRGYAYGTIRNAGGDPITWFNFHGWPGSDAEAIANRQTEYQEVLNLLSGSFIITGDFNAITINEYNIFSQAGCNLANGGDFGTFITHPSNPAAPMDNIITSADLTITDAGCADSAGTSDHKLLYADVMI